MSHLIDLLRHVKRGIFTFGKVYNSDRGVWELDEGLPAGHSGKKTFSVVTTGGAPAVPVLPADPTVKRYFTHINVAYNNIGGGPGGADHATLLDGVNVAYTSAFLIPGQLNNQHGDGSAVVLVTSGAVTASSVTNDYRISGVYYEVPVV